MLVVFAAMIPQQKPLATAKQLITYKQEKSSWQSVGKDSMLYSKSKVDKRNIFLCLSTGTVIIYMQTFTMFEHVIQKFLSQKITKRKTN